jgi:hypothetical protein
MSLDIIRRPVLSKNTVLFIFRNIKKRYVFKYIEDGVLDEIRTTDNVQKHNICTSVFTYRSLFLIKLSDRSDDLAMAV